MLRGMQEERIMCCFFKEKSPYILYFFRILKIHAEDVGQVAQSV